MIGTTTAATFTTTSSVAGQFLMIGNIIERHGVLLEIVSEGYATLSGVQYVIRDLDTMEGGVVELLYNVMVPLYDRG